MEQNCNLRKDNDNLSNSLSSLHHCFTRSRSIAIDDESQRGRGVEWMVCNDVCLYARESSLKLKADYVCYVIILTIIIIICLLIKQKYNIKSFYKK